MPCIKVVVDINAKNIGYTYDASGNLIRKRQYDNVSGVATLINTTDYIDGFVYTTVASAQTLQYFAMPEGRILNNSGTLSPQYNISDWQGNVRIAFDNSGTSSTAKVVQENSYYAFGLVMPGSTVTTPANPEKHLYNGGSEWQNDYGNLPDYYQTYYRNYDAAIGRFVGADPAAEGAESMSSYQYAGNNPIRFNDPLGNLARPPASQGPPTPVIHLHNGVLDQEMGDMEAYEEDIEDYGRSAGTDPTTSGYYRDALMGNQGPTAQAAAVKAREEAGATIGRTDYTYLNNLTTAIAEKNILASAGADVRGKSSYSTSWTTSSNSTYAGQGSQDLNNISIILHTMTVYFDGDANQGGPDMRPAYPGAFTNKAGQILYDDGVVENWTGPTGRVDATFIKRNGDRIELPGVRVSLVNVPKGNGYTLASGGYGYIYLDPYRAGLEDIEHEYGHYLDYLSRGGLYYDLIVMPFSGINEKISNEHQNFWTEIRADQLSVQFFGPNSAIANSKLYPH